MNKMFPGLSLVGPQIFPALKMSQELGPNEERIVTDLGEGDYGIGWLKLRHPVVISDDKLRPLI